MTCSVRFNLPITCTRVFSQSLNKTEEEYRKLQMKVDSLGGESGGLGSINQKAKDMKKEAEDLLSKANKGIEKLKSEYSMNPQNCFAIHSIILFGRGVIFFIF